MLFKNHVWSGAVYQKVLGAVNAFSSKTWVNPQLSWLERKSGPSVANPDWQTSATSESSKGSAASATDRITCVARPRLARLSQAPRTHISLATFGCQAHDPFVASALLIPRRLQSPGSTLFKSAVIKRIPAPSKAFPGVSLEQWGKGVQWLQLRIFKKSHTALGHCGYDVSVRTCTRKQTHLEQHIKSFKDLTEDLPCCWKQWNLGTRQWRQRKSSAITSPVLFLVLSVSTGICRGGAARGED